MLDEETRKALHEIRDALQRMQFAADQRDLRLNAMERAFSMHREECHVNKETLDEIRRVMNGVQASMKVSNFLRKLFLYFAPIAVGVLEIWRSWKGK